MNVRDNKACQDGEKDEENLWQRFIKFLLISRLFLAGPEETEKRRHSSSERIIQIIEYLFSFSRRVVEEYRSAVSRVV